MLATLGSDLEDSEFVRLLLRDVGALSGEEHSSASERCDLSFSKDVFGNEHVDRSARLVFDVRSEDDVRRLRSIGAIAGRMSTDDARLARRSNDPDSGHQVLGGATLVLVEHLSSVAAYSAQSKSWTPRQGVVTLPLMTDTTKQDLIAARANFDEAFIAAVRRAEAHMALADVAELGLDEDSEEFEIAREQAYDERFHCEVCVVREVMEIVWASVEGYLATLEEALGLLEPTESNTSLTAVD